MGRSVSYATGSVAIAYKHLEPEPYEDEDGTHEPTELDYQWEFEAIMEDLRSHSKYLWPSFTDCDTWLDREDHAILENSHAYIGISEYCGMVAIWLKPRTDDYGYYPEANLCEPWCNQIASKFQDAFGTLTKIGTFSNGESVYQRKG